MILQVLQVDLIVSEPHQLCLREGDFLVFALIRDGRMEDVEECLMRMRRKRKKVEILILLIYACFFNAIGWTIPR